MKKTLIIMLILFVAILAAVSITVVDLQQTGKQVKQFNQIFEEYKDKSLLGSEVASLINKAIDNNRHISHPGKKNTEGTICHISQSMIFI